jgi:hypothetical protein
MKRRADRNLGGHAQKIKRKNGSTNRKEKMIAELLSPQAMRF